jgi:hypothetical protein
MVRWATLLSCLSLAGSSPSLVAWYKCDGSGANPASVPDAQGHAAMQLDLTGAAKVPLSSAAGAPGAVMLFGNASSGFPVVVPHHKEIESEEFSFSLWLNYWWDAAGGTLFARGDALSYVMLYRGSPKIEVHNGAGGKTEWTAYPRACSAILPGAWTHLVLSYAKSGEARLHVNGAFCASGKGDSGGAKSDSADLRFPQWAGMLSDFRMYDGPLADADAAAVYNATRAAYTPGAVRYALPPTAVIAAAGRAWTPPPLVPSAADAPMHAAWLNYNLSHGSGGASAGAAAPLPQPPAFLRRIVWSADPDPAVHEAARTPLLSRPHPARRTAVRELAVALRAPTLDDGDLSEEDDDSSSGSALGDSVVIGVCADRAVRRVLRAAASSGGGGGGDGKCPLAPGSSEEAFAVRTLELPRRQRVLLVVGGGAAGMLYGAFGIARRMQLGGQGGSAWWQQLDDDWQESPSTRFRCLNHWNQWRGFAMDAFYPPALAGRGASMFNWTALALNTAASMQQVRDWARLLASVGVNALAPQDVNYDPRCAYLEHLRELPALAAALREFAISLFWTPNFLLAPLQATADALYAAVPDFGGCTFGSLATRTFSFFYLLTNSPLLLY